MASRELMEARCGSCHRERQPRGTFWLARGRALIADRNCAACHELPGYDAAADVRAPRLDGLALKVTPAWLRAWLKQPRAYYPKTRMGEFRLSDRDVEALTAFLLGQPRTLPLDRVDWSKADTEKGGELFRRSRCVTCHSVNGRGGTLAPELTHVGSKVTRDWLYSWIRDPHRLQPKTLMPRFRFADDEVRDLAAYLASEFSEPPRKLRGERRAARRARSRPRAGACSRSAAATRATSSRASRSSRGSGRSCRRSATACSSPRRSWRAGSVPRCRTGSTRSCARRRRCSTRRACRPSASPRTTAASLAVALLSLRAREMPPARTTERPGAARLRAAGGVRRAGAALPLPLVPLDRRHRRHAVDGRARPHRLAAHARPPRALHPEAVRHPGGAAGAHAAPQRRAGGGAAARRPPLAGDGRRLARGQSPGRRGDRRAREAAVRRAGLHRLPHRRREGRLRRPGAERQRRAAEARLDGRVADEPAALEARDARAGARPRARRRRGARRLRAQPAGPQGEGGRR